MASKLGAIEPKSESLEESLVIPGHQFTFSDGNVIDLQLEYLKHALKSVIGHGGKTVVIAFPGSTHAQVKDYADQFKTAISTKYCKQKQTRATTWFSMCCHSAESDLDDKCLSKEIVGVLITNTLQYVQMIREIFTNVGRNLPDISLVILLRYISPDEALTVRTEDPNIGQVYFKPFTSNLDLGDTSHFFRVGFFLNPTDYVMILINRENLYPIAEKSNTNELYAVLPQLTIDPNDPPSTPFNWLTPVLNNPENYSSLRFRQNGADSRAIIYPNRDTVDTRVSKGEEDSAAIIASSELEFFVDEIHTY